jgi:hemoglobin-like flavoprotein
MAESLLLCHPTKVGVHKRSVDGSLLPVTIEQKLLIRKSFQTVERARIVAALIFYRRLFEIEPRLRPLFKSDIESQAQKLMDMLSASLGMLEKPELLTAELESLGARHVGYGVRDEHYAIVGRALLDMLDQVLVDDFTPETRAAWTELYRVISETMQRGARAIATP